MCKFQVGMATPLSSGRVKVRLSLLELIDCID